MTAGTALDAVRAGGPPRGADAIARVQADVRAAEPGAAAHALRFVLATAGGVALALALAWFTHLAADNLFGGWDPPIRPRTLLLAVCVPWAWLGVVLAVVQRPKQRARRAATLVTRGTLVEVAPDAGTPVPFPGGHVLSPTPAVAVLVDEVLPWALAFDAAGRATLRPVRFGRTP